MCCTSISLLKQTCYPDVWKKLSNYFWTEDVHKPLEISLCWKYVIRSLVPEEIPNASFFKDKWLLPSIEQKSLMFSTELKDKKHLVTAKLGTVARTPKMWGMLQKLGWGLSRVDVIVHGTEARIQSHLSKLSWDLQYIRLFFFLKDPSTATASHHVFWPLSRRILRLRFIHVVHVSGVHLFKLLWYTTYYLSIHYLFIDGYLHPFLVQNYAAR